MRRVAVIIVAVVVAVASGTVAQEAYPTRPVTIVNPFPPGGIADLTARPLAAALERLLKQPFVVSNKPGAAGAVGAQSVAVAKPDGYTLLVALVLMFVNIMTYFEGRFPLSLAHSRAGGADAAPEPILHRVEQDRTRGTHSQGTEVYVTISRCHPREDRPVRGRGLGQ